MLRFDGVQTIPGEPGFDLEMARGDAITFIGASGGRRSRLLQAAAGLHPLTGGRILSDGRALTRGEVGYVDEDRSLLGGLTAVENVAARVLTQGRLGDDQWAAIAALLRRLDLPDSSLNNLTEQLSGGQQQRVALGRALFGGPTVLCLDDPVSELDGATAETVWGVVEESVRNGAVLLLGLPEADEHAPSSRSIDVDA